MKYLLLIGLLVLGASSAGAWWQSIQQVSVVITPVIPSFLLLNTGDFLLLDGGGDKLII